MAAERFIPYPDKKGTWSVIDGDTGDPASYRNFLMVRMGLDQADAMADLLNENQRLSSLLAGKFVTVTGGKIDSSLQ